MNITWYYTFIVLASELNYKRAGEKLFITEAGVHNQIKKLEEHLRIKLFTTFNRRIILTNNGQKFLNYAIELIEVYEAGLNFAKKENSNERKILRVCSTEFVATYLLSHFLPIFIKNNPHIRVTIDVKENPIEPFLYKGEYDLGITHDAPSSDRLLHHTFEGPIYQLFYDASSLGTPPFNSDTKVFVHKKEHKKCISGYVKKENILHIDNIKIIESLVSAQQGVAFLPSYFKNFFNHQISTDLVPNDSTKQSNTYLLKNSDLIYCENFCTDLIAFIEREAKNCYDIE